MLHKGDLTSTNNYRCITLKCIAGKIYNLMLHTIAFEWNSLPPLITDSPNSVIFVKRLSKYYNHGSHWYVFSLLFFFLFLYLNLLMMVDGSYGDIYREVLMPVVIPCPCQTWIFVRHMKSFTLTRKLIPRHLEAPPLSIVLIFIFIMYIQ